MKKEFFIYSVLMLLVLASSCEDELDRLPLDKPSDQTFYTNETELLMALNACYRQLNPPGRGGLLQLSLDNMTDVGFQREATPDKAIANGNIDPQNVFVTNAWANIYESISKSNNLLANMDRAIDNVQPELYNRIAAEARFIRSYNYFLLTQLFGDVPLITSVMADEEFLNLQRNSRSEVVDFILGELEEVANVLPDSYTGNNIGRITKGASLALKARVALYNKHYEVARDAALQVMQSEIYSLYPNYRGLFMYQGEGSEEVILDYQFLRGINQHNLPKNLTTRMSAPNGWSIFTPSQDLIDSYESIDGMPIDESPLYNPANPFANRDPRLRQSVILPRVGSATQTTMPGMVWQGFEFKTGREIPGEEYYEMNGTRIPNQDVVNQYASFTGYNWLKYLDPIDKSLPDQSDLNFILIRYAEVLLIYAEAKIELGDIDGSVLDAINSIRARAYEVDLTETEKYPAVTETENEELRKILRRERKVELALEGFRYDDIRRWNIAGKAMGRVIYGRPKNFTTLNDSQIPVIDNDGLMDYSSLKDELRYIETNTFNEEAHYLWPIPQREMDLNPNLSQNPNY